MNSSCVRKGAWSGEEDMLLKKCMEMYGQGKWHLVPQRAGLNRCRKSCRLRWLNYLEPNLNREGFKEDEIDLIIKMHKLLGNRWSIIAGRLPGRTANDIKNNWNSHLSKKFGSKPNESPSQPLKRKRDEVIRPQPWSFSSKVPSQVRIRTNMLKSPQQQQEPRELCMLTPSDTKNMWWNEFLLEDDKDFSWNSCDTNEWELLKDYTKGKIFEAMDPASVKFDRGISEWVDLLVRND